MSTELAAARAAMRARQGAGARYDADAAPADDLDLARRGTAYFARLLNALDDVALDRPSQGNGSRAKIVADVGITARALAVALAGLREGQAGPAANPVRHAADVALAATLPRHALRHLFRHSTVHLDVEWRDLADADWTRDIALCDGDRLAVRDTPMHRARAIWTAALDLDAGGRRRDVPAALRL